VIRLQYTVLMWTKLLEFSLEELGFLVSYSFLVKYQDIGDVIRMNLQHEVSATESEAGETGLPSP